MNAEWHDANPMPKNPTLEQRLRWHLAHQAHCGCRPMPKRLASLRAMKKPSRASTKNTDSRSIGIRRKVP
jgi:hypothetical protein